MSLTDAAVTEKHYIPGGNTVAELLDAQYSLLGGNSGFSPVSRRYFLSSKEQMTELPPEKGAVSYIVQPPLNGYSVALRLWLVSGADISNHENCTVAECDGIEHRYRHPGACVQAAMARGNGMYGSY